MSTWNSQRGVTLVELIIAIVIISIALVGVLIAMNRPLGASNHSLLQTQGLAVAEAYLDEILQQALLDPDGGGGDCSAPATEEGGRADFDDVDDYAGLDDQPPRDRTGAAITSLPGYRVQLGVQCSALAPQPDAALVTVTVTNAAWPNWRLTLDAVRTRR